MKPEARNDTTLSTTCSTCQHCCADRSVPWVRGVKKGEAGTHLLKRGLHPRSWQAQFQGKDHHKVLLEQHNLKDAFFPSILFCPVPTCRGWGADRGERRRKEKKSLIALHFNYKLSIGTGPVPSRSACNAD